MFCGCAGHLYEFCFRRKRFKKRQREYLRNAHHEDLDFPPRFASHATPRPNHRSYGYRPREIGHASLRPNHRSYGYGPREKSFVSQRFGSDPRSLHRGDRYPHRHRYPSDGFYPRSELRHFDGLRFPHHGSRFPRLSDKVQTTMLISSDRMVKCWIPKVYLTNPSTRPSISLSRDM